MAGDVAQFLQKKFLACLSETESELSGAVIISDLGAIKDILISIDTRRLTGDYYCRFISVLLDLTEALTKCQVFSHEWKMHSHRKTHLAVFNHLSLRKICFVWKMKKRLAAIKRIFEAEFMKKEERIYNLRESSSRPYPEENLESELPVVEGEVVGFDGLPLAARTLAEIMSHNSRSLRWTSPPYRKSEELLQLPDFFFGIPIGRRTYPPYRKSEELLQLPDFSFGIPMLVFIDMRREEELIYEFGNHLYSDQVFGVLLEKPNMYNNPETVLKDVYGTLEKLKQNGYYGFASEIQKKMRIIVVGRDDVVNWILGVICDLKLPESPSIAPVPPPTSERWSPGNNENYKYGIAASFWMEGHFTAAIVPC